MKGEKQEKMRTKEENVFTAESSAHAAGTTALFSTFTRSTFKFQKCGLEPCIACKHHQ